MMESVEHSGVEQLSQARVDGLLSLDDKRQWVEERIEEELLPVGLGGRGHR